jgi:hypothetical protein
MIEGREHLRLALETGETIGVGREKGGRTFAATSRCSFVSRAL